MTEKPDASPKCEFPIVIVTPKGREAEMKCGRAATRTINFDDKNRWCVCDEHHDRIVEMDKKIAKEHKTRRHFLTDGDRERIIAAEEKRERKRAKRRRELH